MRVLKIFFSGGGVAKFCCFLHFAKIVFFNFRFELPGVGTGEYAKQRNSINFVLLFLALLKRSVFTIYKVS